LLNRQPVCYPFRAETDHWQASDSAISVQREIQKLERDLNAFNERMAELEDAGHRGHAMEVLKANAIDFARRIDELRCVLVESAKVASKGKL
jgi:hypothetical protein